MQVHIKVSYKAQLYAITPFYNQLIVTIFKIIVK